MKGIRVKSVRTKVIWCQVGKGQIEGSEEDRCSVCKMDKRCSSIFWRVEE